MIRSFSLISILLFSFSAFSHGNHGGVGGEVAQLAIWELPLHISPSGHIELHLPEWLQTGHHHEDGVDHEAGQIVNLAPVLGGVVRFSNRLINLEVGKPGDIDVLESSEKESSYLFIREREIGFGAGVEAHVGHHDGFQFFPGIFPSKSVKFTFENKLEKRSDKAHLPKIKFPTIREDFESWKNGDSLHYVNQGALNFSVGIGFESLATIGTEFSVQGTWNIEIEKVKEDIVEVSISREKLKSIGAFFQGVWIIYGGETWYKAFSKSFVYQFDLKDAVAHKAYLEFLDGRLNFANSQVSQISGVVKKLEALSSTKGRSRNLNFGFSPILGWNHSKGQMFEVTDANELGHSKEKIYSHVFTKEESATGMLIKDFTRSELIASIVYEHDDGEMHYELQYKWMYEKDRMYLPIFSSKISKQFENLGLLPVSYNFQIFDIGYIRGELDLPITEEHLTMLEYLPNVWNTWKEKRLAMTAKRCLDVKTKCYVKNKKRIENNLRYIEDYFKLIKLAEENRNPREISLNLNRFYQAMLMSPNNFKIMSELVGGMNVYVQIKGRNVKQYFWQQPIN